MENLSYYESITKKILWSMQKKRKFPADIIKKILEDNIAFNSVVSKVIEADWKHDITRSSLGTCRYNYCIYGVKRYIEDMYRRMDKNILSLDRTLTSTSNDTLGSIIPDDIDSPALIVENRDSSHKVRTNLEKLEDRYRIPIYKFFFEQKSCREIGLDLGCSRQNVDRIIKEGLNKLQYVLANLA